MPKGYYFEDFKVGDRFTTKARTITEADIVNFTGLSGDFNPLHTDEEFAKKTIFKRRIAHGLLGLAVSTGMSQSLGLMEGTIIAFLGLTWEFVKPIFIGDTVHLEMEVAEMRETSKPDRGIITFACELINQNGEVVQKGTRKIMLKRRPNG